jgi:hypothetical protein
LDRFNRRFNFNFCDFFEVRIDEECFHEGAFFNYSDSLDRKVNRESLPINGQSPLYLWGANSCKANCTESI